MSTCTALNCEATIRRSLLMCRQHWFMVPAPLRAAIWETHKSGDRMAYGRNVLEARRLVAEAEAKAKETGGLET